MRRVWPEQFPFFSTLFTHTILKTSCKKVYKFENTNHKERIDFEENKGVRQEMDDAIQN